MKKAIFVSVLVLFTGFAAAQSFENEPVMGSEDANVTMVMYEDYQCPFCKRFETNTFPDIEKNYIETGKVKVVWKDFPMPQLHDWAEEAATTMECVYREGGDETFWSVKDRVFRNQDNITESNAESVIKTWAEDEGLNSSSVDSCLESGNPLEEVNKDKQEGKKAGISGTPGFLINGEKLVGAQPYSRFEDAIDNADKGEGEEEKTAPPKPVEPPETGGQEDENSDLKQRVTELESQVKELRQKVNRLERTVENLEDSTDSNESDNGLEKSEGNERSREGGSNDGKEQSKEKNDSSGNSGGGVFGFIGGLLG